MLIDYKRMLPLEKARAAEEVLNNPVLMHIINDELAKSQNTALFGETPDERESNRQNCVWINHLLRRLNDNVKLRLERDAGSGS